MKLYIACSLLAVFLAGCEGPNYADYDPHYAFPTTATRKTAYLELSPLQQGHVIALDNARLDDFLDAYRRQGEAPIAVTINAPSVLDDTARKAAIDTAIALQKRGISAKDIRLYVNTAAVGTGPQLAFSIYVAEGRECGNWETSIDRDPLMGNTDNFGCAVQQNIDVMAANPRDLLMPSPSTGREAARSWMVVDHYQQGVAIPGSDDIRAGIITSIGTIVQ